MISSHKTANRVVLSVAAIMSLAGLAACDPNDNLTDPTAPNPPGFAPIGAANNASLVVLTTDGRLLVSSATGPGAEVRAPTTITGLGTNETIRGIDFRVSANGMSTGVLYGVGVTAAALQVAPFTARLYTIDRFTGAATLVPGGLTFPVNSVNLGFDFNPTAANAVRIVSEAEDNLRVDSDTGALILADAALTPAGSVAGAAYTNTFPGTLNTTLYVIDYFSNSLLRQGDVDGTPASPNTGVLTSVGALGVNPPADVGFDIDGFSGTAYLGFGASIYTVNLGTGAATLVGTVGDGTLAVRDIAVTVPTSVLGYGVRNTGASAELVTFAVNAATATPTVIGTIMIDHDRSAATAPVALATGETIVGIDFRPSPVLGDSAVSEGQLFALSQNAGAYCVYAITLVNSAATAYSDIGVATPFDLYPTNADDPTSANVQCAINTLVHVDDDDDPATNRTNDDGVTGADTPVALGPTLVGTAFGFDFNPTVDRIRLISDAGENLRLNPGDGKVVDGDTVTAGVQGDTALSGDATASVATAYTNNFPLQFRNAATPTVTTLFVIDPSTGFLARQGDVNGTPGSPNAGVTTNIGALGANFGSDTTFDIIGGNTAGPAATNYVNAVGYAVSGNILYRVNLLTGTATLVGAIGGSPLTAATVQLKR